MDLKTYVKEYSRMCMYYDLCTGCPITHTDDNFESCVDFMSEEPEKFIEIVQQWANNHPVRTRKSVFLEAFPNADVDSGGCPTMCTRAVFGKTIICYGRAISCKECWNTPMEDENE